MSSVYMSRLFQKSNSSFLLSTNIALQSKVTRLDSKTYLLDAAVGPPRLATQSELIPPPSTTQNPPTRFTNKVGYLSPSTHSTPIRNKDLERCFVDLVTGDPKMRARATSRFAEMLGNGDVAGGGDQPLMLPRVFRKKRVLTELGNAWRRNKKVKGFIAERLRNGYGYSVGIGGYLAFLSTKSLVNSRREMGDRFVIERFNPKTLDIVVTKA